jgi:hypothetical protein
MPKHINTVLVAAVLLLLTAVPGLAQEPVHWVQLICPVEVDVPSQTDTIEVPVYWHNDWNLGGFSLGYHYDSDLIEAVGYNTTGTDVPGGIWTAPKILPDDNLILTGWLDFTGFAPIPPTDSGYLYSLQFEVPAGVEPHCVNIDSAFVPPAGEFLFSPVGQDVTQLIPEYRDCEFDINIGNADCGGGPVGDPPVAVCQDVVVSAGGGCQASVTADQVDNGSSDPDGTIVDMVLAPAGPYDLGITAVKLIVTDNDGNKDTCDANIEVQDNTDPVFVECPEVVEANTDPGVCQAAVDFTVTADDNCDAEVTLSYSHAPGSVFPKGTTAVTVTATDDSGNEATCNFDVIVSDNENPVAICPDDIVVDNDPGECGAIVNFAIDATDNCPGESVSADHTSGSFFPVGVTTVTVTAEDAEGNVDECTFTITVNDTEAPVAACPANIEADNDPGECGAVVDFVIPDPTDNCPGAASVATPASGSLFDVGTTQVEVVATDASGNKDTCYFDVIVTDIENPVVTCPDNINVQEEPGTGEATVEYEATASDNCGVASITYDPPSGTTFGIGTHIVTVTVTDVNSNQNTCDFSVTVIEINDPPVAYPDTIDAPEDIPTNGQLLADDPDDVDLTYTVLNGPFNGSLTAFDANTGAFTYLSNLNYNGKDSLEFLAEDLTNESNHAWVLISVTPTNDLPEARDTSITVAEDGSVDARVHGYDIDGDDITFTQETSPDHGAITAFNSSTGEFTYEPDADYNGDDSFTFSVSDGTPDRSVDGTVTITVTPVNDAPVARDTSIFTDEDVAVDGQVHGYDIDGDDITFTVDEGPARGELTAFNSATGEFTYLPDQDYNGDDSFTFIASDGNKADSDPATVSITIEPVNDAPVAPDTSYVIVKETPGWLQLPGYDVDGDELFWEILAGPFEGEVDSFETNTGRFFYVPDEGVEDVLDSVQFSVSEVEDERGRAIGWAKIQIVPPAFFDFDPDSLYFEAYEYSPAPASQELDIISIHPNGINFDWTAVKNADWLSLSNTADSTPATIFVSVEHEGLLPGTYIDSIFFRPVLLQSSRNGPEDTVVVTLKVNNPISYDSVIVADDTAMVGDTVELVVWSNNSAPTDLISIPFSFDRSLLEFIDIEYLGDRVETAELDVIEHLIHPMVTILADFPAPPQGPLARGSGNLFRLVLEIRESAVPGTMVEIGRAEGEPFYFELDDDHSSEQVTPTFVAGSIYIGDPTDADDYDLALPNSYSLAQNYPNPFNPETIIEYSLPSAGHVTLTVYNVLGQSVVSLVNEYQSAGTKRIVWDARDEHGQRVDSGVYFYRMTSGDVDLTRKMVLMK